MPLPISDLAFVLEHTRDLWDDLRGANLFVSGGTGFFGVWLTESFLYANRQLNLKARATILTRRADSFQAAHPHLKADSALALCRGDARTFDFPRGEFSHVIHAATQETPHPLERFNANLEATRRMLDFAVQARTRRFLFASSGAVYGRQPPELTHVPETYLGAPQTDDPASAYGQSKRASEFLCAATARERGLDALIARCFAFVGPRLPLDANFAVGNFVRDALNGKTILVKGDGTPRRSYLYAADLAVWLWTILFKGESCRPYNVGSDEDYSIAEIAQAVAAQFPQKINAEILGKPDLQKPPERYVPDVSRAKDELNLIARVRMDEGIRRMIKFYQEEAK
ncbi:MAG: NAD-dependent epimerase/dehydratase family protein [Anaerolineales bacterium]|nr:NAD-dependent epimerase/dehydratase family protein [Anaerolineales bacterium]